MAVRNGQLVAETCPSCGCRLNDQKTYMSHFYGQDGRDAQGHLCEYYHVLWVVAEDKIIPLSTNSNYPNAPQIR